MSITSGNGFAGSTIPFIVNLSIGLKNLNPRFDLGIKTEISRLCGIPDHQQGIRCKASQACPREGGGEERSLARLWREGNPPEADKRSR